MLITDLKDKKLKPLKDMVAFRFIEQNITKTGFYIPVTYRDLGLRAGKLIVGQVLAVAPKVKSLKPNDFFLFHEYGLKNFEGTPDTKLVYFIEEKNCKAKLELKDPKALEIFNISMSAKAEKSFLEEANRGIE